MAVLHRFYCTFYCNYLPALLCIIFSCIFFSFFIESASTTAANRLVAGSESEELPSLELPQTASLPSEGVEYSNFQANQIKQLMDKLTGLIYRRIRE